MHRGGECGKWRFPIAQFRRGPGNRVSPTLFEFEPSAQGCFDGGIITSDAGGLLLGRLDRGLGLIRRMASCFTDRRDPRLLEHTVETLVGQRVFALALGYEDLNDHDELRHVPCAGRQARDSLCAGGRQEHAQPAGARPRREAGKYHKIVRRAWKHCSIFLDGHKRAPKEIVLETPPTTRSTASKKVGSSMATTTAIATCRSTSSAAGSCSAPSCAPPTSTGPPARSTRSPGSSPASGPAGRRCGSCCAAIRASAARSLAWCEAEGVAYLFGLAPNARLKAVLAPEAWEAARLCRTTGKAARLFRDFAYQTETSWSRPRRVVGKAEHLPDGANPRFVVTSLGREKIDARGLYEDLYCARGEMENRIKECQDLFADRTSSATMQANQLPVVRVDGLRAAQRVAPDRAPPHPVCRCHLRHHLMLKIGALVRRSVRVRHGLGLSLAFALAYLICSAFPRFQAPAPRHVPARARLRP